MSSPRLRCSLRRSWSSVHAGWVSRWRDRKRRRSRDPGSSGSPKVRGGPWICGVRRACSTCPRCGPVRSAGGCCSSWAARVVKLESLARPDGARQGQAAFFDAMNAGKASVALDFGTPAGREQLAALMDRADIVIEASRPRALAAAWHRCRGDGRGPARPELDQSDRPTAAVRRRTSRIAYGDDAGVAGGLSELLRDHHRRDAVLCRCDRRSAERPARRAGGLGDTSAGRRDVCCRSRCAMWWRRSLPSNGRRAMRCCANVRRTGSSAPPASSGCPSRGGRCSRQVRWAPTRRAC